VWLATQLILSVALCLCSFRLLLACIHTRSYKKLAQDVQPGSSILCADGSIVLEVISTDPAAGTVRARCKNTAMLGERKNVNLPGVVVDLPTLTDKDVDDIVNWGVANEIDLIAASFVRKGIDLDLIREVLGERGRYIKIISKVRVCVGGRGGCVLGAGDVCICCGVMGAGRCIVQASSSGSAQEFCCVNV
jgi:hypothetical protein